MHSKEFEYLQVFCLLEIVIDGTLQPGQLNTRSGRALVLIFTTLLTLQTPEDDEKQNKTVLILFSKGNWNRGDE